MAEPPPAARSKPRSVDRSEWPYRMKDLCQRTGMERQAIHFYIQQGLLPEGKKTGRNTAFYNDSHVARILLVRRLQEEQFLPLRAIRAVLQEQADAFSPAQQQLLAEIKARLQASLGRPDQRSATVDLDALLARAGVPRADADEMVELGLLAVHRAPGQGQPPVIAEEDAWMLELWGQLRTLGFSRELGFRPRDLLLFEEAIASLFQRETALISERLTPLGAARAATMVERALPLINMYLVRSHNSKVRSFIAAL